jgi:hypothetical protein
MRVIQSQYHDQLGFSDWARELWLALRTIERAADIGLDLEDAFIKQAGISFTLSTLLSFLVFATINGAGQDLVRLDPDTWLTNSAVKVAKKDVDAFFAACSITYDGLKEAIGRPGYAIPGYEAYAFSPLIEFPMVRQSDGLYVVPVARDILERPTRTLPVYGLRYAERSGGRQGLSRFNSAMGDVYEQYVRESFEAVLPKGAVRRADDIIASTDKKCDLVIRDPAATLLVEVKGGRFRLSADMTKDYAELKAALSIPHGIADGVIQLNETASAIRAGKTDVPKNSNLIGLLVVRGEQVWLNSSYFREALNEVLQERKLGQLLVRYQLSNDLGLEALIRLAASGRSVSDWLFRKSRSSGLSEGWLDEVDIHIAVPLENLPPAPFQERNHAALDEVLKRFGFDPSSPKFREDCSGFAEAN